MAREAPSTGPLAGRPSDLLITSARWNVAPTAADSGGYRLRASRG